MNESGCFVCSDESIHEIREPEPNYYGIHYNLCKIHSLEQPTFCETCGERVLNNNPYCSNYCSGFVDLATIIGKNSRPLKSRTGKETRSAKTKDKTKGRLLIFSRDRFQCIYCGKTSYGDRVRLHLEYIIPRSKGGQSIAANLVTSCQKCNLYKGNLELPNISLIKNEVASRNLDCKIYAELIIG